MLLKKLTVFCVAILMLLSACSSDNILEPERCSLCDDLSRHAPCIVNLSTGEKLELEIYEPHPFLVGEIAEEQRGGYFSFVRGAGVEGYKLGAESATVTIPTMNDKLDRKHFCTTCRELLSNHEKDGYVMVDLINTKQPVIYSIADGVNFSFRCYEVSVTQLAESSEYEIIVIGTYNPSDDNSK